MSSSIEAALLAVSLCALGPCGDAGAPAAGRASERRISPADVERMISLAEAERIALERVPGGTVEDMERETRLGEPVIEVEVRGPDGREYELVIDASGRVISEEIDD